MIIFFTVFASRVVILNIFNNSKNLSFKVGVISISLLSDIFISSNISSALFLPIILKVLSSHLSLLIYFLIISIVFLSKVKILKAFLISLLKINSHSLLLNKYENKSISFSVIVSF